jgi:hypothetical protein
MGEAVKLVKAYILSNLQERLDLTDDQYAKLFPLVSRLQDDRHGFAEKRNRTLGEMSRLLRFGAATESRLVELLEQLRAVEVEEPKAIADHLAAIDAVLTPVQQAKYRVYEMEVGRRIRDLMRSRRRGGEPVPRAPGDPEP